MSAEIAVFVVLFVAAGILIGWGLRGRIDSWHR